MKQKMQEHHLFEYAVLRVVPRVEREEFINVGVILFCQSQKFLQMNNYLDRERLRFFAPDLDIEEIEDYLQAIKKICAGGESGGAIGLLPVASRFRWLTATRSSVIQASKVHPGYCNDPQITLDRLCGSLVL
jgi:hypothetical protein